MGFPGSDRNTSGGRSVARTAVVMGPTTVEPSEPAPMNRAFFTANVNPSTRTPAPLALLFLGAAGSPECRPIGRTE